MSAEKMSRFSILFVIILFCFYPSRPNCIFATPITAAEHADQNITYHPEIAGPHYLQSVVSELLTKVLIDPFKQIAKMTTLYLEIFSVASGTHIFPITNTTSQIEDRQQQVIAIASTNLWLNLTMIESLNAIFLNASRAVTPILDNNNTNTLTQALPRIIGELFEKIETCVTKNNSLAPLYMAEKSKVEKLTLPVLASSAGNPDTAYELYPRFRAFIVRRQILQHLTAAGGYNVNDTVKFQQHVLSHAVIQLANGAEGKRIQEIFDEAVQITVDKIDSIAKLEDPSGAIDRILFPALEQKLTADFKDELAKVKQDLIKKYGM